MNANRPEGCVWNVGSLSSPGEMEVIVRCFSGLKGVGISPFPRKQTAQGDPCKVKHHSNMQQLTLQFEGYADEMRQPVEVSATKQRVMNIVTKAMPKVILFSQAAAAVTFGFGLMFLAAIIGG